MVMSRNHSFTATACVGLILTLIFSFGVLANTPPEDTSVLPEVLRLHAMSVGSEILVLWVEPQDPEEIVSGYKVYLDSGEGYAEGEFVPKGTRYHLIRGLEPGDYKIKVTTVEVSGEETGSPETQVVVAGGRDVLIGFYVEDYNEGPPPSGSWLAQKISSAEVKSFKMEDFFIDKHAGGAKKTEIIPGHCDHFAFMGYPENRGEYLYRSEKSKYREEYVSGRSRYWMSLDEKIQGAFDNRLKPLSPGQMKGGRDVRDILIANDLTWPSGGVPPVPQRIPIGVSSNFLVFIFSSGEPQIQLPPDNEPPTAVIEVTEPSSLTVSTGTEIIFDGSNSEDPEDGDVATYLWEVEGATGTSSDFSHIFTLPDTWTSGDGIYTYTVKLTVEDSEGATDDETVTVEVLPPSTCGIDECECENMSMTTKGSRIDLIFGNYKTSLGITHIQNQTISTNITLSYNSANTEPGPLGPKWHHNFEKTLVEHTGYIILMMHDGSYVMYYDKDLDGTFQARSESGIYAEIVKNGSDYVLTYKNGMEYTFNSDGNLTGIKNRNNDTVLLTYAGDNLSSIIDQYGRTTTLGYNGAVISEITDPDGNTTTLTYNGSGQLTQVANPESDAWLFGYNAKTLIISSTKPDGAATLYQYDSEDRVTTITYPDSSVKTIEYVEAGKTIVNELSGGQTEVEYDPILNVWTKMTDPENRTTDRTFDDHRNMLTQTKPCGPCNGAAENTYDSNGNLLTETNTVGKTTTYTYNELNLVASVLDPMDNLTGYEYNEKGNRTKTTDALWCSRSN